MSKIKDTRSTFQVIGCLLQQPELLISSNYNLTINDFPERFHKIVFGAISTLFNNGKNNLSILDIDSYISNYKDKYETFINNKGIEYLESAKEMASIDNYTEACKSIKKYSLVRDLEKDNFDITEIYDSTDETMVKKFAEMSIEDILGHYQSKLILLEGKYLTANEGIHIAEKLNELVQSYVVSPEMGVSSGINALDYILYGLRKKYYIFSASSGYGKSRMLAYLSIQTGVKQNKPTLFITTELDESEMQSMILAGISGVPERHIILNQYKDGEKAKVAKAIEKLEASKLYIVHTPDFTVESIENLIKKYIFLYGVEYVMFDYIKQSMSIISSMNKKTGGGIATWQMLVLLSETLKKLSGMYNVGVYSATQLNPKAFFNKDSTGSNQSQLSGATGIADHADLGLIIRPATQQEKDKYQLDFITNGVFSSDYQHMFFDVYKNRKSIKDVSIGLYVNLGTLDYQETVVIKNGEILKIPKVKFM